MCWTPTVRHDKSFPSVVKTRTSHPRWSVFHICGFLRRSSLLLQSWPCVIFNRQHNSSAEYRYVIFNNMHSGRLSNRFIFFDPTFLRPYVLFCPLHFFGFQVSDGDYKYVLLLLGHHYCLNFFLCTHRFAICWCLSEFTIFSVHAFAWR